MRLLKNSVHFLENMNSPLFIQDTDQEIWRKIRTLIFLLSIKILKVVQSFIEKSSLKKF